MPRCRGESAHWPRAGLKSGYMKSAHLAARRWCFRPSGDDAVPDLPGAVSCGNPPICRAPVQGHILLKEQQPWGIRPATGAGAKGFFKGSILYRAMLFQLEIFNTISRFLGIRPPCRASTSIRQQTFAGRRWDIFHLSARPVPCGNPPTLPGAGAVEIRPPCRAPVPCGNCPPLPGAGAVEIRPSCRAPVLHCRWESAHRVKSPTFAGRRLCGKSAHLTGRRCLCEIAHLPGAGAVESAHLTGRRCCVEIRPSSRQKFVKMTGSCGFMSDGILFINLRTEIFLNHQYYT